MVHIKKVDIFGFKSFGFRNTTVRLEPGLVSISGPNGSGKSTILDAIIFATGEMRPTRMRVDKIRSLMHDVDNRVGADDRGDGSGRQRGDGRGGGLRMTRVAVHFDNTDRRIPVASDTVSVARELDENGENSTYYLNNKKDSLTHITDLLDVARAGLGNLNVVQQGTVTRISEFTPTEKRKAIEDLIGISSFDEKTRKAQETLDQADRKLEVALASMGEVKKRIDELEEERNIKLRHDLLRSEIDRYRAIDAASQLQGLESEKASLESELASAQARIAELKAARDKNRSESARLEGERSAKMESESVRRHARAALEAQISESVKIHDEAASSASIAGRRLSQMGARLEEISVEKAQVAASQSHIDVQVRQTEAMLAEADSAMDAAESELRRTDESRRGILARQSEAAARRAKIDDAVTRLNEEHVRLNHEKMQAVRRRDDSVEKMSELGTKHRETGQLVTKLRESVRQLDSVIRGSRTEMSVLESKTSLLGERRAGILANMDGLEPLVEAAERAATRYESKIKTVRGFMHEDYTAARLREDARSLGIEGLVYEMMSWDPAYERPVMAAGSDWIKAMVVQDFDTLLGISEAARSQNLPRFKIIPLEAVRSLSGVGGSSSAADMIAAASGARIIGTLADHVRCDPRYDALRTFLFGGVMLVEDRESAVAVSESGHRAVTTSGEYFEARGGAMAAAVDMGSKISNITRLISMSGDVEGLLRSISLVRRYMQKRKGDAGALAGSISLCEKRMAEHRDRLRSATENRSYLESRLASSADAMERLPRRISELRRTADEADAAIASYASQAGRVKDELDAAKAEHASDEQTQITEQLAAANDTKAALEPRLTEATTRHNRVSSELSGLRQTARQLVTQAALLEKEEAELLGEERPRLLKTVEEATARKESEASKLAGLRQQEQEMISVAGSSIDVIKEYDGLLRGLHADERALTKEAGALERRHDRIERDLSEMSERAAKLRQTAAAYCGGGWFDHNNSGAGIRIDSSADDSRTDAIGVRRRGEEGCSSDRLPAPTTLGKPERDAPHEYASSLIRGLESELESLVDLNANAPHKYLEVTHGYRTQSVRKNSLESERNSIVRFITRIEREKRQTFLDAFEAVDGEIRQIFKKMTGGSAWLELQDEDAIFESGISYLVQFPDKRHRDSASISGGEKTLAAVVFVLALQKLQPSPYYLFDEVDAHLDAQNAEKLSSILAERARESQFIVVSLKDSVVEKAGLVYGVFPKGGVSNVVMYKDRRLLPSGV